MNKKDIEQLAEFITEDPREFHSGSPMDSTFSDTEAGGTGLEAERFSHSDIKVDAQEREAQKRELADIVDRGKEAQQFLSYIESVEHMSRSGLEY